ncbi:MAG: LEA type 2 family protein [Deltaproteobacteria bacterium]|nr:LEA type 2 family protein [Deltaproteobacteria bacterium]
MKHAMHDIFWRILALLAAILALAGSLGCGVRQLARGEIEAPRVEFRGVVPGMPSQEGLPFKCLLALENPNQQALDVLGYDYELWLENQSVAQGASSERIYLPPQGKTEVEFPVFVKLPAVLSVAPAALNRRRVNYQIGGGFRLASVMGGLFRVPFRFRGQTTLDEGMELMRLYVK